MGIGIYESRYVINSANYEFISFLIKILCLICTVMSFIGCLFVKCDITHILCCLCFILPLSFGVPAACFYGMTAMKEFSVPTPDQTKDIIKIHMKNNSGKPPSWLRKTEEDYHCCGIRGYKDYDDFQYPKTAGLDLPKSCCANKDVDCTEYKTRVRALLAKIDKIESRKIRKTPKPRMLLNTFNQPDETENSSVSYINSRKLGNPNHKANLSDLISVQGCYEYLRDNTTATHESQSTILIVILVCSLLMSLIYMQNFCTYGPCRDEAYLHSLDVEELPFMEVKVPAVPDNISDANSLIQTPMPPSTPHQEENFMPETSKINYLKMAHPQNPSSANPAQQKKKTRPADLPASVAVSLTHKRLRKYM